MVVKWFDTLWLASLRVRNDYGVRRAVEVEAGVWLGGAPTRRRWAALRAAGVRRVLCLQVERPPLPWLADAEASLWLPVRDRRAPTVAQLWEGCAFLDAALREGRAVLICCAAGMGRAPTMYVAWRMSHGMSLEEALRVVQRVRVVADPTPRQLSALRQWAEVLAAIPITA